MIDKGRSLSCPRCLAKGGTQQNMAFSKSKMGPQIYAKLYECFENSRRLAEKTDGCEDFEKVMQSRIINWDTTIE